MGLPIVAGALQCRLTGHTLYPEHRAIFCLVRPDQTGGLNAGHRVGYVRRFLLELSRKKHLFVGRFN